MTETNTNWARNYVYRAAKLHRPTTIEQVQELVSRSTKVKALGSRHSFNDIADSTGDLISLEHLNHVLELDQDRRTVTVEAGVRYGELGQWLHERGYALHNLASLPHISIVGACSTGTHGSGDQNGNLATVVSSMEMIKADGEIIAFSREKNPEDFHGAVVGLGGMGLITKLTLDIIPTFQIRQDVYENLPLTQLEDHFDELSSSAYSVSLFTDWRNATFNQVWLKSLDSDESSFNAEPTLSGATRATRRLHPIASISAENCTEQMGIAGPWHERLPHFRMDFTPSSGEELQSEYLIPRQYAFDVYKAIDGLRQHIVPLLQISEVRTIAADSLWMSPCYHQDSVAIHFTWKKDWAGVSQILPILEDALAPFHARPHWGKLFTMHPSQLQSLYEKLPQFQELLRLYDPEGKFRNPYLDKYILGDA
ncbi:MAG TPA: FAD-binding protein [Anaerolineales bacterium]|nr:FAD-binding protein [Anaerolineales bacterium]